MEEEVKTFLSKRLGSAATALGAIVYIATASIAPPVAIAGMVCVAITSMAYTWGETTRPSGKKGGGDKPLDGGGESG